MRSLIAERARAAAAVKAERKARAGLSRTPSDLL
jgi:hypothetical protein